MPACLRPLPRPRRTTTDQAYGAVDVPESVIDLLTGVRNYLQASGGQQAVGAVGWVVGLWGGPLWD